MFCSYRGLGIVSLTFEIEIKLRLPGNLGKIRRALRDLGFRVSKSRLHESNVLLDTSNRTLRSHGKLIRVRRVGTHNVLTYKGPSEQGRYKKRHEIEVMLPDAFKVEQIFNEIGYHPIFRYEKFRTEYAKAPSTGKVLVDETPIGNYLEIEGSPGWIDRTARLLGFSAADYITRSYGYLYLAYCRERRIPPGDMLFTAKEMRQLRKNITHA
ncbi:MAG TPA: class IV adenylate cyclase [Bryobacteraceae bacterium]|nr:class IV adenylate cyclase [Bryobacteraceae bacterium]